MENAYGLAPGSSAGIAIGEEMGPIIAALKEGSAMTRYYANRKRTAPDLRIFMLKMEEFQLVWCRMGKEGGRQEGSGIQNLCATMVIWSSTPRPRAPMPGCTYIYTFHSFCFCLQFSFERSRRSGAV